MATAAKPHFRFTHPIPLRKRTLATLDGIEGADPVAHRDDLAGIIVELTSAGMNGYFLEPLAKLKMGLLVTQSANLGVASVVRIMGPTIRNVVSRMDAKQLRQVSRIMREMMA